MRKLLVAGAVLAAVAAAIIAALHVPALDVRIYRELARRATAGSSPTLAEPNELAVLLCGTGSPLPDRSRAGPCALVAAGSHLYLIDAGLDSARNLLLWHVPLENIDAIFVTHFHSDHIAELGEMRLQTWVAGRKQQLPVYGPPGVAEVVGGFNEAYALDAGYRTAHHGAAMLPSDVVALSPRPVAVARNASAIVFRSGGLTVTAIRVRHDPADPAYGYRFDYGGRSIVISGDTAPCENLARGAKGADVLVHEGLSPQLVASLRDGAIAAGRTRAAKIFHDIPAYHTSPVDAARIANEAGVRLLVFTHLIPPLPNGIAERAFLDGVSDARPSGVVLGHDGLVLRLPADSTTIEQETLD